MLPNKEHLSVSQQLRLLLQWKHDLYPYDYSLQEVAETSGISLQVLFNILSGQTPDPRLNTLRNLSQALGISLDYFICRTETECRDYLALWAVKQGTPMLKRIVTESKLLSPRAADNVLVIVRWLEIAQQR